MVEPRIPSVDDSPPPAAPSSGSRGLTPVIVFGVALLSLSIVGLLALAPSRVISGMPDDAELRRVPGLLRVPPGAHGDLRFESSFATPAPPGRRGRPAPSPRPDQLDEAGRILLDARARHPRDPRVIAGLGAYELALARLERAERHYRSAVDRAGDYGEARLGLGVTLADRAETEGDPDLARRLRLAAIGQLAAVREDDPVYLPALFDRTLLLVRVGRQGDARRWAGRYAAIDSGPASDYLTHELLRADAGRDRRGSGR